MTDAERNVVLAFMAHPDDAEIFCGGTLIRLADAGWEVHISTMTPGDCGTTSQTRWDISATRTHEAADAAAKINATYHCLDEKDGYVCYDKPTLHKAVDLFRRVAPSLLFLHPTEDYMMDHVMASQVGRAASFLHGAPNASDWPILEGTCVPHTYYCDPLEGNDIHGQEIEPTCVIDISDVLDRKADGLATHASQREWLRAYHGMDEYIEGMKRHAAHRGGQYGVAAAEAFRQHLGHAYPHDDWLGELLGQCKH
jgi:LmbE family N-acetylglucosaminyl deacetylase